ncbi:MAG: AraC family transcriptional regulator [Pseudomonadales bacterium]|nr:AraC family transcriptional regulator [Pseudomonadales bacterium]
MLLLSISFSSQTFSEGQEQSELAQKISTLKEQVIQLNRDLFILQEELLFPAETQVAVFLSIDSGSFFSLDSVEIQLDKKPVHFHLYTEHQRNALERGGVQKLWLGNIKQGEHEIIAHFKGMTHKDRAIERASSLTFEKQDEPVMLELQVIDAKQDMRPHFSIKQWQE